MGLLVGPYECDSHTIGDIVIFTCLLPKQRKAEGKTVCGGLAAFLDKCYGLLFPCLRGTHYGADRQAVTMPPPALKTIACKRNVVKVDAEAAWHLIEKATKARTNLEQALALKDDEDAFGCHDSQGSRWINFLLQLYCIEP